MLGAVELIIVILLITITLVVISVVVHGVTSKGEQVPSYNELKVDNQRLRMENARLQDELNKSAESK